MVFHHLQQMRDKQMDTKSYIADANKENFYGELTGLVPDLLENGDLSFGKLLDNDNVYATFDPSKNSDLLLGCQFFRYTINIDDPDESNTQLNIDSVDFQPLPVEKLNLRYVYCQSSINNIDGSVIMNWNMNDSEKSVYFQSVQTTIPTNFFSAPYEGNENYLMNSNENYNSLNYRYFNNIDRTKLMYIFYCTFFYIDDNNNIVTLSIPFADVLAHLQSDDENFIYDGHTVYPFIVTYKPAWKTSSYLWTDNERSNLGTTNFPYLAIERYVNDKLVHVMTGIHTSLYGNQTLQYTKQGFTVKWEGRKNWSNNIYNGTYTNCSSYGYTALPDGNEKETYLTGYTPYAVENDKLDFTEDIYINYSPPSNTNLYKIIIRNGFFYILQNTARRNQERGKTVTVSPVITLKDICSQFALTLIPFVYRQNIDSPSYPTNSEYVLIGKRNADGSVSGEYEVYDWDNPQTETSFRPDDFVPLVPTPPTPEEYDRGTSITGDSQSLRAPTNLTGCSGFLTHYVLTATQLANFGSALWASFNDSKFWQALGAVLADSLSINPADILNYIVSLRCYPVDLISSGISTTDKLYIGRGTVGIDLGGSVAYNTDMTLFKSCGSVTVPQLYRNYLDYAPYTTISLYLPFCGEFELNATEVSGGTLTVHYAIDFTTGICTAYVINAFDGLEYIILTASGQIGQELQLTAGNFAPVAYSLARAAIGGLSAELTGGLSAKTVAGTVAGAVGGFATGAASNIASGLYPSRMNAGASFNAFYAPMTPYLKIRSSRQSKSSNWNSTSGNITTRARYISELSGLIFCINPDCTGIPATTEEINQIKTLLENGIHV